MLTITRLKQGGRRTAVPFRIRSYQIDVEIKNQLSRTKIEQVFVNPNDFEVDSVFLFPLADDVPISTIALSIDDEDIKGEVLAADRARRAYKESAVSAENKPILKYIGSRAYSASVGKITANSELRVQFEYSQVPLVGGALARYTHPLFLAKVTQACIENFRVNINISDPNIQWLCSPSHGIVVDDKWRIDYAETNLSPDRDLVLEYAISDPDFGIGLVTHRENANEDGYFLLFLSPRYQEQIPDIVAKDFTFVLDRSANMIGKLQRAKEALRHCIHNLTNRDRFRILAFNSDIISLNKMNNGEEFSHELGNLAPDVFGEFLDVRHNRKETLAFIENIEGRGRGNLNAALLTALSAKSYPNRQHIIVLLTDGCATDGVANTSRILKNVAEANAQQQARIFVFGVGTHRNVDFLDRLAIKNGGIYHHLEPYGDIKETVLSLFKKANDPGLADIEIDYGNIVTEDVYPQEPPDMFSHEQLTLAGRYKGHGPTRLEIRGHINGETREFIKDVHFNESQLRYNFLPRLWAERKVNALMEEIGQNPRSRSESYKEIIKLMNAYGIPPTFQQPSAKRERIRERRSQHRWYQWCFENVKYLGRKTFYRHEHIWMDGEYDGVSETKKIVIGDPEYCDLINREPDLKRYLKLHKEMILCHKGVSYQIVPDEV